MGINEIKVNTKKCMQKFKLMLSSNFCSTLYKQYVNNYYILLVLIFVAHKTRIHSFYAIIITISLKNETNRIDFIRVRRERKLFAANLSILAFRQIDRPSNRNSAEQFIKRSICLIFNFLSEQFSANRNIRGRPHITSRVDGAEEF